MTSREGSITAEILNTVQHGPSYTLKIIGAQGDPRVWILTEVAHITVLVS